VHGRHLSPNEKRDNRIFGQGHFDGLSYGKLTGGHSLTAMVRAFVSVFLVIGGVS